METLAGGGQGTVYLGREDGSEGVVAIKVMHPGHTGEALYLDALRREANLATRLEHPNVTQILDFQVEDGAAYLVTQYVWYVLSNHISPETPLPAERVIEIGKDIPTTCAECWSREPHGHDDHDFHIKQVMADLLLGLEASIHSSGF